MLWSEPRGGSRHDEGPDSNVEERERMDQQFYLSLRRYIIVANDEGHCTCV
jgi:hypothetical protein